MSEFTLKQLEYFVHAVETGSLTGAAKICHVTHAGISNGLNELERSVGAQLLIRRKAKGVVPTVAGQALLPLARRVLRDAEDVDVFSSSHSSELAGNLVIGCNLALAPLYLPRIAGGFLARYPRLRVDFRERVGAQLLREVGEGQLDAALLFDRQLPETLPRITVGQLPIKVALSPQHHLASRSSIKLAELTGEPMLVPEGPAMEAMLSVMRAAGVEPWIRWKFTSPETIRVMVANGFGYSLLNAALPDATDGAGGIVVVDVEDHHAVNSVVLVTPLRPQNLSALDKLVDFLRRAECIEG